VQTSATPYAALHDIDANKPGGSIKIRVKTYAHSLKLHEEVLEDSAKKNNVLVHNLDAKRLELMELKRAQMEARQQKDETLDQAIAALAEKVRAYVAPPAAAPDAPKGLVQLKKKPKTEEQTADAAR
jgi:hypothetical protein